MCPQGATATPNPRPETAAWLPNSSEAQPPPQVRNPFDMMTAAWIPGVGEKAAVYGHRSKGGEG